MAGFEAIPDTTEKAATVTIDAIYKVHKILGPGLLESVYEVCLTHELELRGIAFKSQVTLPIVYEGHRLDAGLRLDVIVDDAVVVEIKAVDSLHPVHEAQMLTYLKITGKRLGLLVNFNVPVIRRGIKRIIL